LGDSSKLLFVGGAGRTPATEQLRNLRARISDMRTRRALKSLVISSSLASEGKTFLAANLAHAFARQHDRKILLVDADLRHSQLHRLLGAPAEPGLSEYLCGAATEEQILQRGPQENLFFIPAGKVTANPGELLSAGQVKRLVERLAPLFDWILVDTPAVADSDGGRTALADAHVIAQGCDGVLLVVHSGATPREAAQAAAREFSRDRLLGVVLNHATLP
jgi:capsular exopolysaccharide synthesis family protein